MSVAQGTKLRNGKVLEPTSENPPTRSSTMTEVNYADTESVLNKDIFSQLAAFREKYEKQINDLQAEYSLLKDLMMAVLEKSNKNSQNENGQDSSKKPMQGLDIHYQPRKIQFPESARWKPN